MKTLAHEILDIEAEAFEVPQACYDTLEDILAKAGKINVVFAGPRQIFADIGKLLKESGFSYKQNGLLSHALETKQLDCKHYSVLYYSIGEMLHLPLHIVRAPMHLFVRWDGGGQVCNWETTSNSQANDFDFNIDEKSRANGVYLRNLTRKQAKAVIVYNHGTVKAKKGDFDGAIADFTKAIELNPEYADAYNNRGDAKADKGNFEGAIADFTKAIELDPKYATAYNNRGTVKAKKGDLDGAIADFAKAIELDPKYADAYNNRGIVKKAIGDSRGAEKDFEMYERIRK
jgi:tetratricopeptide (TPR) repeat protein